MVPKHDEKPASGNEHWPFLQIAPAPQRALHWPQLVPLESASTHAPPQQRPAWPGATGHAVPSLVSEHVGVA